MLCVGRGYMGEKANVMTYRLCNLLKNPAADRGGSDLVMTSENESSRVVLRGEGSPTVFVMTSVFTFRTCL